MILQILLTIVFGFGVLTLATVALLNTAGHKLHGGKRLGFAKGKVQFQYDYPSDDAETLRKWFARLPIWLGFAAAVAVVSAGALYVCAGPQGHMAEAETSHLNPVSVITWVGMGLYVLALVGVTTWLSRWLYAVLQDVEQVDEGR